MTPTERLDALATALCTATTALAVAHEHLSELRMTDRDQRVLTEIFGVGLDTDQ